jgi:GTP-binding protein Era
MNSYEGLMEGQFRSGFVAIIGEPNVGKSTLLNTLIGTKIAIVTNKPQTTRHKIVGIVSRKDVQIILFDTPGILTPRYMLHEVMMNMVRAAVHDVDVVCLMVDAKRPWAGAERVPEHVFSLARSITKPVYLLINKTDIVKKDQILQFIATVADKYPFKEIFPISALQGDGTDKLLDSLAREMPEHPAYYPSDMLSEQSERFFVEEIIREKIFEIFEEEIPYSTTVDIIEFRESAGKKDLIRAEIYVERDSQKGILIGKHGGSLKGVGERARRDIESFLGRPVFLELYVKVREKWRESESWLKRLGYTK